MLCVVSCVCSTTNKISPRASSGDYSYYSKGRKCRHLRFFLFAQAQPQPQLQPTRRRLHNLAFMIRGEQLREEQGNCNNLAQGLEQRLKEVFYRLHCTGDNDNRCISRSPAPPSFFNHHHHSSTAFITGWKAVQHRRVEYYFESQPNNPWTCTLLPLTVECMLQWLVIVFSHKWVFVQCANYCESARRRKHINKSGD